MSIGIKNIIIITFRSKFSKKLLTDENKDKVMEIVKDFCRLNPSVARYHLWRMSYDSETVVEEKFKDTGLDLSTPENVVLFRNELRYQYEKLHPEFCHPDLPEKCEKSYSSLKDKMMDTVAPYMIWQRIQSLLEKVDKESIDRTLYLLGSNKEANYFGGLRSLRFNLKEANFLKPYYGQIYFLLKEMSDYMNMMDTPNAYVEKAEDESNTESATPAPEAEAPAESSQETSREAVVELPTEEVPNQQPATSIEEQAKSDFKELNALTILENRTVFEELLLKNNFNQLVEVGALGFDLNKVMARKSDILGVLQAAKKLEDPVVLVRSPFEG